MAESLFTLLVRTSISMTICGGGTLIVRRALSGGLTARSRYHLWYLFLLFSAMPFLSHTFPALAGASKGLGAFTAWPLRLSGRTAPPAGTASVPPSDGWLNSFSISVSSQAPERLLYLILAVWATGVFAFAVLTASETVRLSRCKRTALPVREESITRLFSQCRRQCGLRREIPLRRCSAFASPVTIGLLAPCILLPAFPAASLSETEMRHILLHELQHVKHKDLLSGWLFRLLLCFCWFHPMVWLALREMESDREMACDASVLALLGEEDRASYGTTLLNFAARMTCPPFSQTAGMGGSKKVIRRRITGIAAYRRVTGRSRAKSGLCLLLAAVFVFSITPVSSALSVESAVYQDGPSHMESVDLSRWFDGADGSFVLYDAQEERYLVYQEEDARKRVSPVSTYKIYSALMALDTGIITPDRSRLAWDGERWPFDAWNRDQTLHSALHDSVNWYFTALDQKNGADTIKQRLSALPYGNLDFSGGLTRFWLESSLKISPLEQVQLLTGLSQGTLPFDAGHMAAVREALLISSNGSASLHGKTGTGNVDGKTVNGWFIGFVESDGKTWAFSVHLRGEDGADGKRAGEIALQILDEMGIYSAAY